MMSLSKEWSILSEIMYGGEFKDELAKFLKNEGIESLLECGCGDGNIAKGLAIRLGIPIFAIDLDTEMIELANKNNSNTNVTYREMSWLDLDNIDTTFDSVMCRGNSLSYATCWAQGPEDFDPNLAKEMFEKSIHKMKKRLNPGGLLYVDTVPQSEVDNNGGEIKIELGDIKLKGVVEYDLSKRLRYIHGEGTLNGEYFKGGSVSYLFTPDELRQCIKKAGGTNLFSPKIKSEPNYEIVCARFN